MTIRLLLKENINEEIISIQDTKILDILKEHNIKLYRVATGLRLGLDEEEVINYYLECRYLDKTANYFDCSEFTISKISFS